MSSDSAAGSGSICSKAFRRRRRRGRASATSTTAPNSALVDAEEKALLERRLAEEEARKQATATPATRGGRLPHRRGLGLLRHLLRRRDGQLRRHVLDAADYQRHDHGGPVAIGLISIIPVGRRRRDMVLVGPIRTAPASAAGTSRYRRGVGAVFLAAGTARLVRMGWRRRLHARHGGTLSAIACFWSLPTAMLSGTAAAAGIAWINSVGNLAGYVRPFLLGAVRDATRDAAHPNGNMLLALSVLAVSLFVAGAITLALPATEGSGLRAPGSRP